MCILASVCAKVKLHTAVLALVCAVKGLKPTPAPLAWCDVAELGCVVIPELLGTSVRCPIPEHQRAQDVLLICSLGQRDLQSLHGR